MRIQVVSRSGRPLAAPMGRAFDAQGGIIGRSPDCSLVLPDPNRHISRQQARIEQVGRDFFITCLGASNAIVVGGDELGPGQSSRLAHGDTIVIGEYEMRVDLGSTGPTAQSSAPARNGSFAREPEEPFDPFAEFEKAGDAPAGASSPAETFPEFAPQASSDAGESVPTPSDPLGLGAAGPRRGAASIHETAESIDAIFGLGGVDPDPLRSGSPLVGGAPAPGKPGSGDASASVIRNPRTPFAPRKDRGSELSAAMALPEAIPPTNFGLETPAPEEALPAVGKPVVADASRAPFLSWEDQGSAADPARGPPGTTEGSPARTNSVAGRDAIEDQAPTDEAEALLQAFLDGLGLAALPAGPLSKGLPPRTLSPELMHRAGELLKTATDGTIDLLRARTTLKREMQAEVTFIVTSGNNPLKFSPDSQAALAHLLSPKPVRGFMEPVPALRDAFDDLLAHQMGILAGMRAAMHSLLARFDPVALQSRLAGRSVLDALVPSAREARLWELFNERYSEISREAEDDFEELFAREFAKAYEEQIARLGSRRP